MPFVIFIYPKSYNFVVTSGENVNEDLQNTIKIIG